MLRLCRLVPLVAASAAVAVGPAAAKGPDAGSVCGGLGCVALSGWPETSPFISWWNDTPFVPRDAPRPAPYYAIQLRDDRSGVRWALLYVPSRQAIRIWQNRARSSNEPIGPYWRKVPPAAADSIRVLVRTVSPYPTPRRWRH